MTWDNMVYMQDMTPEICASQEAPNANATIAPTKTLRDKRDNKTYTISKLKDGNCWMTENLRIIDKTINSTDSDMVTGSFTIPVSNTSGFSDDDIFTPKAYYNISYGGNYNWYTATAGAGNANIISGTIKNSSICPKGWHLPVNGDVNTDKSYANLLSGIPSNVDGVDIIKNTPYYFIYGGRINDNSIYATNSDGYYWSSTAYDARNTYGLHFSSNNISPSSSAYLARRYGLSIRCVAR